MDWFPRMRAMSLVSNEGDSEQNEIRNLQEKLESTMSLVKQLSGQLAELKEQVSALSGAGWGGIFHLSELGETQRLLGARLLSTEDCKFQSGNPMLCCKNHISSSTYPTSPSYVTFLPLWREEGKNKCQTQRPLWTF